MLSAHYVTPLYLLSVLFVIHSVTADVADDRGIASYQYFGQMPYRPDLSSLRETLQNIDGDLEQHQKRTCQLGINNHHCALVDLDRLMASSEWLKSGHSPGKRASPAKMDKDTTERLTRVLEEIARKRGHLAFLKNLLAHANVNLIQKQKRSCQFDIGGQCRTELASAIADQYYYLNGPNSPGKRRRRRRGANIPVDLSGKSLNSL